MELDVAGGEVVQVIGFFDGLDRICFTGDPDLFAAWRNSSNVIGPSRSAKPSEPEAPPSGGAVKPAA